MRRRNGRHGRTWQHRNPCVVDEQGLRQLDELVWGAALLGRQAKQAAERLRPRLLAGHHPSLFLSERQTKGIFDGLQVAASNDLPSHSQPDCEEQGRTVETQCMISGTLMRCPLSTHGAQAGPEAPSPGTG